MAESTGPSASRGERREPQEAGDLVAQPDDLRDRPCGGFLQGDLPTGCGMCTKGAKLVLFVTGVCHYNCFYCPISDARRMNHGAWANERRIPPEDVGTGEDLDAIAEEVRLTRAYGTGLTGGDPMFDPERTLRFIRFLKEEFGEGHHIHIYTQIPFDQKWLPKLHEAGLDEFRFHPPEEIWSDVDAHPEYASLYRAAQGFDWDVGFEIPCIPGWGDEMRNLTTWLDDNGFPFLNLNEFEFSETNFEALKERGHETLNDVTYKAKGSAEVAREVMMHASDRDVAVHFCSSPFKDAIQLRARLRRRAESVARAHEVVTDDGTLLRGVLDPGEEDPHEVAKQLRTDLDLPDDLVLVREPAKSQQPPEEEDGTVAEPEGPAGATEGRSPDVGPVDGKGRTRGPSLGGIATTGREIQLGITRGSTNGDTEEPALRLEVAPWVLHEVGPDLPWDSWISEVYPTADELEVERIPVDERLRELDLDPEDAAEPEA